MSTSSPKLYSYHCAKCQKGYKTLLGLNKHNNTIQNCDKTFECKSCKYITNDKSNFTKHLVTNKCQKKKTKFICIHCNKSFIDNANLKRHYNRKNPCYNVNQTITTTNNNNNNITNNINYNILNINMQTLNKVDKLLYEEVKNGKNIEDYRDKLIEVNNSIKRKKPLFCPLADDATDEEIEEQNENYERALQDREAFYMNIVLNRSLFNGTELPPIYNSSKNNEVIIKHADVMINFDEKALDIINTLLQIDDQLKDKSLKAVAETLHDRIAEKFKENRSKYYEDINHYYNEDKRIDEMINIRQKIRSHL